MSVEYDPSVWACGYKVRRQCQVASYAESEASGKQACQGAGEGAIEWESSQRVVPEARHGCLLACCTPYVYDTVFRKCTLCYTRLHTCRLPKSTPLRALQHPMLDPCIGLSCALVVRGCWALLQASGAMPSTSDHGKSSSSMPSIIESLCVLHIHHTGPLHRVKGCWALLQASGAMPSTSDHSKCSSSMPSIIESFCVLHIHHTGPLHRVKGCWALLQASGAMPSTSDHGKCSSSMPSIIESFCVLHIHHTGPLHRVKGCWALLQASGAMPSTSDHGKSSSSARRKQEAPHQSPMALEQLPRRDGQALSLSLSLSGESLAGRSFFYLLGERMICRSLLCSPTWRASPFALPWGLSQAGCFRDTCCACVERVAMMQHCCGPSALMLTRLHSASFFCHDARHLTILAVLCAFTKILSEWCSMYAELADPRCQVLVHPDVKSSTPGS